MHETETDDWDHWFNKVDEKTANEAFKLILMSYFYESALMYYNIVVDLSWVLCYTTAEFACTQNGNRVDYSGLKTIEDAARLLRSAENNVTTPTAETNPFGYLKKMNPSFFQVIDIIINFWDQFSSTKIRRNYNYCKHKGKPAYSEIEKLRSGRFMGLYLERESTGEKTQIATDIKDVRLQLSFEEGIDELYRFDD